MAQDIVPFADLTARVAGEFAIEPKALWNTLKSEFFPGGAATDEQMFLVLQIMDKYKLNPFMREMFAAISKKTGKLLVGVQYDGFNVIAHRNPRYKGFQLEHHRDKNGKIDAVTCKIYRDDWEHPGEYLALMSEWFIPGKDTWEARPVHQLGIKAFNNCVKLTLGLSGLYDSDDIQRIQAAEGEPAIETTVKVVKEKSKQVEQKSEPAAHFEDDAAAEPVIIAPTPERVEEINRYQPSEEIQNQPPDRRAHLDALIAAKVTQARLNLLLGQNGVDKVEDFTDTQVEKVIAMLEKK